MFGENIDKMECGKDKELMLILKDKAQPFLRKNDGYACKVEEDKEITYKNHNDEELTLKVPAGSYIVSSEDGCYPKIMTADEFESKNNFVEGKKEEPKKKDNGPQIGMALMSDEQNSSN